jgi:hypothetical protein
VAARRGARRARLVGCDVTRQFAVRTAAASSAAVGCFRREPMRWPLLREVCACRCARSRGLPAHLRSLWPRPDRRKASVRARDSSGSAPAARS